MIVTSEEFWKKRIIEKFIERSSHQAYRIRDVSEILNSFGRIELAANTAWDQLFEDELLVKNTVTGGDYICLNPNKQLEIMKYYNKEPVEEVRTRLEPSVVNFENLERHFEIVTEKAWPNQGTYYLCTRTGDPTDWVALFRSKPHKNPTRMNLGSLKNPESRITRMWGIVRDLGKDGSTFYKKQAEDLDQKAFGNNRQPGTAAFGIFCHLRWIREVERCGAKIFYALDQDNIYDDLVNGDGHVCFRCARVSHDPYCDFCNMPT